MFFVDHITLISKQLQIIKHQRLKISCEKNAHFGPKIIKVTTQYVYINCYIIEVIQTKK